MNPLSIRLARPADADAIAALSRVEIEHGLSWSWTPSRIRRAIADRSTNVVVAMDEDETLAGFGVMVYRAEAAHLSLFAVAPGWRRRGVGTTLLDWLEKVGRVAGLAAIRLEARRDNEAALAFYGLHGYAVKAEVVGMYQGLEDGVKLEKRLRSS
jgi:ribosomal protein S18 acetylase RimI-like enzyme